VTTRYVASLFEAVGCDRVVTLDVHNLAAYQNAFRCPADHLEAKNLFVHHFVSLIGKQDVVVVSPDIGGVKRVDQFRQSLSQRLQQEVSTAVVEKYRSGGVVSGDRVIGDMHDRVAIIIDDLSEAGLSKVLAKYPYQRFPVASGEEILGVVSRKEIEAALAQHRQLQLQQAVFCSPEATIREVGDLFMSSPAGMILVFSEEERKVKALVTLHDLLRAQTAVMG
jgi:CBS domain-containing protein